jgi:hypothetical protein
MSETLHQKVASVRIFPTLGIARVGNSVDPQGWFYGPEVPGHFDEPPGGFKDAKGAVKRQVRNRLVTRGFCRTVLYFFFSPWQAARFRVYAFDERGNVLFEANSSNDFELEWKFEIANKKASWYTFTGNYINFYSLYINNELRCFKVASSLEPSSLEARISEIPSSNLTLDYFFFIQSGLFSPCP